MNQPARQDPIAGVVRGWFLKTRKSIPKSQLVFDGGSYRRQSTLLEAGLTFAPTKASPPSQSLKSRFQRWECCAGAVNAPQ
jgi:hypothetical protein